MKKGNLDHSTFSRCADLILDALEDAFNMIAPRGREASKKAIIAALDYYTKPKSFEEVTGRSKK